MATSGSIHAGDKIRRRQDTKASTARTSRPGLEASLLDADVPTFSVFLDRNAVASPGTVVSLGSTSLDVTPSRRAYDPRVVGVVVGVSQDADGPRVVRVAIGGLVRIRVCLDAGPITSGDLLVASDRPGVAVRARNNYRAIGAVVAKALESVPSRGPDATSERLIAALVMR